jgi:UDP-N-acetylglucosamine 2-epimerase (non-hydrolysing)
VHVVGNPVIDLVAGAGVRRRDPRDRRGVVLTAHRPTNVDDPARLAAIVAIAERLVAELGPVTFPVHPRTALRLRWAGLERRLDAAGVDACPPLPYRRMLEAVARAELVVTDSGGLQEEASWFGVPVLVVRRSTPRWEGVAAGVAKLVGLNAEQVVAAGARLTEPSEQRRIAETPCLYGDGKAARRIAGILADPRTDSLLELREPDFARTPSPRW